MVSIAFHFSVWNIIIGFLITLLLDFLEISLLNSKDQSILYYTSRDTLSDSQSLRAKRLKDIRELFIRAYQSSVPEVIEQPGGIFSGLLSRLAASVNTWPAHTLFYNVYVLCVALPWSWTVIFSNDCIVWNDVIYSFCPQYIMSHCLHCKQLCCQSTDPFSHKTVVYYSL